MTSFSKWDRDAYRSRVGEEEAARRRGAIMAEQWGYQLAEQRKRKTDAQGVVLETGCTDAYALQPTDGSLDGRGS